MVCWKGCLEKKYKDKGTSSRLLMRHVEEIGEIVEVLNQLEARKENSGVTILEQELLYGCE